MKNVNLEARNYLDYTYRKAVPLQVDKDIAMFFLRNMVLGQNTSNSSEVLRRTPELNKKSAATQFKQYKANQCDQQIYSDNLKQAQTPQGGVGNPTQDCSCNQVFIPQIINASVPAGVKNKIFSRLQAQYGHIPTEDELCEAYRKIVERGLSQGDKYSFDESCSSETNTKLKERDTMLERGYILDTTDRHAFKVYRALKVRDDNKLDHYIRLDEVQICDGYRAIDGKIVYFHQLLIIGYALYPSIYGQEALHDLGVYMAPGSKADEINHINDNKSTRDPSMVEVVPKYLNLEHEKLNKAFNTTLAYFSQVANTNKSAARGISNIQAADKFKELLSQRVADLRLHYIGYSAKAPELRSVILEMEAQKYSVRENLQRGHNAFAVLSEYRNRLMQLGVVKYS